MCERCEKLLTALERLRPLIAGAPLEAHLIIEAELGIRPPLPGYVHACEYTFPEPKES